MQGLSSYYEYEQVICITMNEYRDLRIYRSSNRLIAMEEIKRIGVDTIINKQCGILVKHLFQRYFQIQTQSDDQQTKDDESIEASIIDFMEDLRQDLMQDNRTVFDKSQILFCLPLEWTESEHKQLLRSLFLASGWITNQDHEHRLIFSRHIERLVNYLQGRDDISRQFERERRYLFCYISETSIKLTCFQMQSDKELITVSKRLAASDFLLTPTFLDEESISLSNFETMIYSKVKSMITNDIVSNAPRNTIHNKPGVSTLIGKIVKYITYVYMAVKGRSDNYIDVVLSAYSSFFEYKSVRDFLNGWTCGAFIDELLNDADIKLLIQQSLDSFKRILEKYSLVKNSPESIQDIILYADCENSNVFLKSLVRDILLKEGIIDQENDFMDTCNDMRLCEGAMQKPCKMIQIANALLPPMIQNDDDQVVFEPKQYRRQETNILPSNSFYLQARMHQHSINFILNKVVTVSVVDNIEQKSTFTVQEETIPIADLLYSACDLIWEHYQGLDSHFEGGLWDCCDAHTQDMLSINHYCLFKTNLKRLMEVWVSLDMIEPCDFMPGENADTYQSLPISDDCHCFINISRRILLEVGLKPAIENNAATVASTLASNSLFGLYSLAALIVTDEMDTFCKGSYFDHYKNIIFQESMRKCLQVQQKRPAVFFDEASLMACDTLGTWSESSRQILGRGNYTQVSGASYGVRLFAENAMKHRSFNGLYEYHQNAYKKNRAVHAFPSFIVLSKGDYLHHEGVFYFSFRWKQCTHSIYTLSIGLYSLDSPGSDQNWQRIWFPGKLRINRLYPFTIKISPQNHSSSIKIEFTYVKQSNSPALQSDSIIIHERLILNRH
ncbi:hypothetical protein HMPREF1544_09103 [Mucor circinelloides 1006PhL]|uniref:Uncharacterized protein n=1 Tax=Mucor circinelloides f. circinelloides (strain 1006PhL) TaxID=1220926 RepID=S2JW99_MUCC1|nr:hypothetical protein HMPREF1544_09103 [Mucor circinelloides 1006PhL]